MLTGCIIREKKTGLVAGRHLLESGVAFLGLLVVFGQSLLGLTPQGLSLVLPPGLQRQLLLIALTRDTTPRVRAGNQVSSES